MSHFYVTKYFYTGSRILVGILNGKINFLEVYVFLRRHGFEMKKKRRFCEKSSEGLVILVTIQMYWIICFVYKEILCFNVSNGSYHVFFLSFV